MGLQILEREHSVYLANPNMQPEMYYFTTETEQKEKIPKTISNWMERFDKYNLKYLS
jgi:thiamine-monophosphate kinase